jgi:iron complex outermembrane receptor protein
MLMLMLPVALHGQSRDSLRHYMLEDSVIVVAGRYSTSLVRSSNALTVIQGNVVERMADHSLLEAIQWEVPSAFLVDTRVGGFGVGTAGTGMLSLRGMGGKPNTGVAVMMDGHPDFMGIFGHPLPDVYGMDDIERVDVLLGPASTVFGGHAMGGVINVVSREALRDGFRASIEAGSWNTWSGSMAVTRILGSHGFRLSLRHSSSDGHVPQSDFRSTQMQAGWDWKLSPAWKLRARGRYVPSRFDDPSRSVDPAGLGTYGDIRRGMGQVILENSGTALHGSTQLFLNAGHHEFFDGFVSDDQSAGFSTYQQYQLAPHTNFAAGGEFLRYGGTANLDDIEHILTTAGVYVLAQHSPTDFLHLRAGMRLQHHSLGFSSLAPNLGVSVTPLPGLRFYASMQSGFRHPTLRELYLFPSSNATLTEERTLGFETGTEFVHTHGSVRVAVYRNDADDMIAALPTETAPPPLRFVNAVDAQQWGVDVSLRLRLLSFLHAQMSWNTLHPDQLTAFNPSQQFKYMLNGSFGALRLTVGGQYVHGLFAGNDGSLPMPDYHVLEFTASWQTPWAELYVKTRNLLDRHYAILPGYIAPGAHVLIGVRYALEH